MSIAPVVPMPARSCDKSPPAGGPDLIRRPGATGDRLALTDDIPRPRACPAGLRHKPGPVIIVSRGRLFRYRPSRRHRLGCAGQRPLRRPGAPHVHHGRPDLPGA
jgi:hypothetical protein